MNILEIIERDLVSYKPWKNLDEICDYVWNYMKDEGVYDLPKSPKSPKIIAFAKKLNEKHSLTAGRQKFNLVLNSDALWEKLVEMGYSEGDIINSDDVSEASDELGMDFSEAMDLVDELEEAYNVSVMSNDMLAGDGPGNYYETDSSANISIDDLQLNASALVWNYLQTLGYSEGDIVSSDDFTAACNRYNLDEDSFGEDDYSGGIETIENLYHVQIFAPEVIEGDGPGNYVYIG